MNDRGPGLFFPGAFLPGLVARAIWFLVIFALLFVAMLAATRVSSAPFLRLISAITVIALMEIIRALWRVDLVILREAARLWPSLKTRLHRILCGVRERGVLGLYHLATALFFLYAGRQLLLWSTDDSGGARLENDGGASQLVIVLVAMALPLLFTGLASVTQALSKRYAFALRGVGLRDSMVQSGFIIITAIGIGNVLISYQPANTYFRHISASSALYILVIDLLILLRILKLLQSSDVLWMLAKRLTAYIRRNIHPLRVRPLSTLSGGPHIPWTLSLKLWFATHVLGLVRPQELIQQQIHRSVPEHVREEINERTKDIAAMLFGAVTDDNLVLLKSAGTACATIAQTYASRMTGHRKSDGGADFSYCLYAQLEMVMAEAVKKPNQEYTASLVDTAREVSLALATIPPNNEMWHGENKFVLPFSTFLRDAVSTTAHQKHSAAPLDAVVSLGDLALKLFGSGCHMTAVGAPAEHLGELAEGWAGITQGVAYLVVARAMEGLKRSFQTVQSLVMEGSIASPHYGGQVSEKIKRAFAAACKAGHGQWQMDQIVRPLLGALWTDSDTLPRFLARLASSVDFESPQARRQRQCLEETADLSLSVASSALVTQSGHAFEAAQAVGETIFILFCARQSPNGEIVDQIVTNAVDLAGDLLGSVCTSPHGYQYQQALLDEVAILSGWALYFSEEHKRPEFLAVVDVFLARLIELLTLGDAAIDESTRNVFKYAKLIFCWVRRFHPGHPSVTKAVSVMRRQYAQKDSSNSSGYANSMMQERGYPCGCSGMPIGDDVWIIRPSEYWENELRLTVTEWLHDPGAYVAFEDLLAQR